MPKREGKNEVDWAHNFDTVLRKYPEAAARYAGITDPEDVEAYILAESSRPPVLDVLKPKRTTYVLIIHAICDVFGQTPVLNASAVEWRLRRRLQGREPEEGDLDPLVDEIRKIYGGKSALIGLRIPIVRRKIRGVLEKKNKRSRFG